MTIRPGDAGWDSVMRWGSSALVDAAKRGDANYTYTDLASAVNEYVDDNSSRSVTR